MKQYLKVPLISAIILTFASCSQNYLTYDGSVWGTSYHIVYDSNRRLDSLVDSVLEYVDAELSMFNSTSTISRINDNTLTVASAAVTELFALSQRVNQWSDGHYDPTVGPLTDLWGFGRKDFAATPSDSAVAAALLSVGIDSCTIAYGVLRKKTAATQFDFSSIAKGYGVDLVATALESAGVTNYLVEIGGEVTVKGVNPRGEAWHIQIDAPRTGIVHERLMVAELGPERTGMATSGNYRNFRSDSTGIRYGHTLSPKTGCPVATDILAATVLCNDCAMADALATACMASADTAAAFQTIRRADAQVEALLVIADGDSLRSVATPGFYNYIIR